MNGDPLDGSISAAFDRLVDELRALGVTNELFLRHAFWEQYRFAHRIVAAPPGRELLDWGAGVGHFGFVQHELGARVTAFTVDIEGAGPYEDVLRALAARNGLDHRTGSDPVELPFPDASFDIAVSCGVLEHVREFGGDDQGSLRELHRVLRPGGRLLCLHLPNRFSASEAVRRRLGRTHHAFTYRADEFERLATNAGFTIEASSRYGVVPWNSCSRLLSGEGARWLGRADRIAAVALGVVAVNHSFECRKDG